MPEPAAAGRALPTRTMPPAATLVPNGSTHKSFFCPLGDNSPWVADKPAALRGKGRAVDVVYAEGDSRCRFPARFGIRHRLCRTPVTADPTGSSLRSAGEAIVQYLATFNRIRSACGG